MNRMSPADKTVLDRLMAASRRVPRQDREEELELVRRHRHGDARAGQALTLCHLGLVVRIARHLGGGLRGQELDLVQEGFEGLLHALRTFDPDRGVPFSAHAAWWIRAYVLRFVMRNWRLVRVGGTHAQRVAFFNLHRELRRAEARGEPPDFAEIAQRLGMDGAALQELAQHLALPEGGEDASLRLPAPAEQRPDALAEDHERRTLLHRLLDDLERELPARERAVMADRWRCAEPRTLRACGEDLGLTGERVRQIERGLLTRLCERAEARLQPQRQTA
jgi:RNA polymerase sigma-32 factor